MVLDSVFAIGGFYGGSIGNLLSYWEQSGFFTYALPFLLVTAIVLGILTRTNIFGSTKGPQGAEYPKTGLNAVIAIAIGLLSLQFDFVPMFFSEIFPRLGIGLSVIMSLLILVGLFLPSDKTHKHVNWIMLTASAIVFLFVIGKSFGTFTWWESISRLYFYSPEIITTLVIVIALGALIASATGKPTPNLPDYGTPVWRTGP